jgi:hypothetical protein
MDNDSSIHKGVYLSIIKFCKEQITEESEVHRKTTLITSKPMEMTNNKQQTAVEMMWDEIDNLFSFKDSVEAQKFCAILDKYNEIEKERIKNRAVESYYLYTQYLDQLPKVGGATVEMDFKQWYEKTYGGNK